MGTTTSSSTPAQEFLDALRFQGWTAGVALLPDDVVVNVPDFDMSLTGRDAVHRMLQQCLEVVPDLTYAPRTRRIGSGLVVDEGFVTGNTAADAPTPQQPLRVTMRVHVRHDDAQVHDLTMHLDRTPLLRAMGQPVDWGAAILSDIQGLRAGMFAGLEVHTLEPVALAASSTPPAPVAVARGHSGRKLIPIVLAVAVLAGGGIAGALALGEDNNPKNVGAVAPTPTRTPTATATPTRTPSPTASPKATPSATPKPTVVLSSDLAFSSNSAAISPAGRAEILRLARKARTLTGVIRVDGYTDNVGSAASGLVLSRARANAVAEILRDALGDVAGLTVRAVGHGESDPVASNATTVGRAQNRRVTITLPPAPQN